MHTTTSVPSNTGSAPRQTTDGHPETMRVSGGVLGPMLVSNMALLTVAGPAVGILASTLIERFDLAKSQIGLLNAGYAVIAASVSPFTGRLADRIGGRNTMTLGFLVAAMVFALFGSASGYAMLVGAAVLSGVPNGMANQGTNKYISAEVPVARRGIITGVKQSGVMFGVFLAGLLLPRGVTTIGYRQTMFAVAGLAVAGAVVVRLVLPADPSRPAGAMRSTTPLPSAIRWLATYAALMGAAIGSQSAFLALYLEEDLGYTRAAAGLIVGMTGLVAVGARITLGRLTQTVTSYAPVLILIAGGSTLSFLVIRLASEVGAWLVLITPVIAGFTTSSWNAPVMLASMRLVPPQDTGRSAGLVMLGFMSGYSVGPPIFGRAVDHFGSYNLPWLAGIALCCGAATVAALWRQREISAARPSS